MLWSYPPKLFEDLWSKTGHKISLLLVFFSLYFLVSTIRLRTWSESKKWESSYKIFNLKIIYQKCYFENRLIIIFNLTIWKRRLKLTWVQTLLHKFLFEIVIFWIRIFKCQKHETSFWFWLAGEIFFLMLNANERTSRHPLYPSAQSPFTFSLFLFFTAIVSSLLSFLSKFFLYLSSLSSFICIAILNLFSSLIMNFHCHIFSLYVYLVLLSLKM